MLKSTVTVAAALAFNITSTWAGTVPKISGSYAINFTEICQAVQSGSGPGSVLNIAETGDFDSSTGTVQFTGTATGGELVVWTGTTSGMQEMSVSHNWPYSNTATTVTINGTVYNVAYGSVKKGVAQSGIISGIGSGGTGCVDSATVIRQ